MQQEGVLSGRRPSTAISTSAPDRTTSVLLTTSHRRLSVFSLQGCSDKDSILPIVQVLGDLLSVGEWARPSSLVTDVRLCDSVWPRGLLQPTLFEARSSAHLFILNEVNKIQRQGGRWSLGLLSLVTHSPVTPA